MIYRIAAEARLDTRPDAADRMQARAACGDRESALLLEQWRHGHLVLACVVVTICAEDEAGRKVEVTRQLDGVWLERADPPDVESQVADVAPWLLRALADDLRALRIAADDAQLDASFVHVELADELLRSVVAG